MTKDQKRSPIGTRSAGRLRLRGLLASRKGATTIEYAFIASLVSVAASLALQGIGAKVSTNFDRPVQAMAGHVPPPPPAAPAAPATP